MRKLKANPSADRSTLAEQTLDDQAKRSLAPALTDEQFTTVLQQFKNVPGLPAEFVERGSTAFSPSFVTHMLTNAEAIEKCERDMPADEPPPSDTDFSNCIPEFPRSAVMVKTSWVEFEKGIPQHTTDAAAMAKVIENGTWPLPSADSMRHPSRRNICTNVSKGRHRVRAQGHPLQHQGREGVGLVHLMVGPGTSKRLWRGHARV